MNAERSFFLSFIIIGLESLRFFTEFLRPWLRIEWLSIKALHSALFADRLVHSTTITLPPSIVSGGGAFGERTRYMKILLNFKSTNKTIAMKKNHSAEECEALWGEKTEGAVKLGWKTLKNEIYFLDGWFRDALGRSQFSVAIIFIISRFGCLSPFYHHRPTTGRRKFSCVIYVRRLPSKRATVWSKLHLYTWAPW